MFHQCWKICSSKGSTVTKHLRSLLLDNLTKSQYFFLSFFFFWDTLSPLVCRGSVHNILSGGNMAPWYVSADPRHKLHWAGIDVTQFNLSAGVISQTITVRRRWQKKLSTIGCSQCTPPLQWLKTTSVRKENCWGREKCVWELKCVSEVQEWVTSCWSGVKNTGSGTMQSTETT